MNAVEKTMTDLQRENNELRVKIANLQAALNLLKKGRVKHD